MVASVRAVDVETARGQRRRVSGSHASRRVFFREVDLVKIEN